MTNYRAGIPGAELQRPPRRVDKSGDGFGDVAQGTRLLAEKKRFMLLEVGVSGGATTLEMLEGESGSREVVVALGARTVSVEDGASADLIGEMSRQRDSNV